MRVVIQRVSRASVTVDGAVTGEIATGLLVLVGVTHADTEADAHAVADKLVGLRIFPDDAGQMNRSLLDVGGSVLVVSQFTLYGTARKGRRPSFTAAAAPEVAEPLVAALAARVEAAGIGTATGRFGARMEVTLTNDGPVTILLESADGRIV